MSNHKQEERLFSTFHPTSKKEWIEKATADLKGADFDKRLVWKHLSGLELQPFYTREDRKLTLENTGSNKKEVFNYRRIKKQVHDKNASALRATEEGMTGVIFELNGKESIPELLEGIDLGNISVGFELNERAIDIAHELKEYFGTDKSVKGYVQLSLWKDLFTQNKFEPHQLEAWYRLTEMFLEYPDFKTLAVNGSAYMDAGGSQVQEIAYLLNSVVWIADEMTGSGLDPKVIFDNLQLIVGIGSEYFVEIAKFRAINSLMHEVAGKYGLDGIGAVLMPRTSVWTKSVTDANTNMLRATTEAMSAMLGNADALEIDPYDSCLPDQKEFSPRIAGNIVTILREESYFGKVANPADGSYYVEEVTHELARKSLELFKMTEAQGGFFANYLNGNIPSAIAEIRQKKIRLLSQRRLSMVGVNKYPNLMEKLVADSLQQKAPENNTNRLVPRRAGLEMELIRYRTEKLTEERGKRPKVVLVTFGNLAMRKARATFAFDFLGVGGYAMEEEKSYGSAQEAADKSAVSDADIVVICSSDEDYREHALGFVRKFREEDSRKVLLLAGNPADQEAELNEAGLDGSIHMRSDIFDSLTSIHEKLSRTPKSMEL